jgi:hypothetical protein
MAAFGVSYEMPSLEISVRNASSVELTAPAVPAAATAASPRAPATSAVPANLVMRCEANIGLLVDVGLFRVVSGLTSESDSALAGSLENPWGGKRVLRGYGSAVLEPPIV